MVLLADSFAISCGFSYQRASLALLIIEEETWIIHKHANHWINLIHMVLWFHLKDSSVGIIIHISNLAGERRTVAMSSHSTSLELCGRGMLWVSLFLSLFVKFAWSITIMSLKGHWRIDIYVSKFSLTIHLQWNERDAGKRGFSLHHYWCAVLKQRHTINKTGFDTLNDVRM